MGLKQWLQVMASEAAPSDMPEATQPKQEFQSRVLEYESPRESDTRHYREFVASHLNAVIFLVVFYILGVLLGRSFQGLRF